MKHLCLCLWLLWPAAGFAREFLVYFGTYTAPDSQGIYVSRLDTDTGRLSAPELAAKINNPSFLAVSPIGHFLYAGTDTNSPKISGAVRAFAINNTTGQLTPLNQKNSGGNSSPCHLAVDATGRCLFVANYGTGSLAALPVLADGQLGDAVTMIQHSGTGPNPARQAGPHAHSVYPSPDNRFVLNCDLGLDKIFIYRLDPATAKLTPADPPFAMVAPGAGPRHLTFSRDGKFIYVVNEMGSSITAFSFAAKSAAIKELQTVSTLPPDFSGNNTAAEIVLHPNGKFLYASNRGHDNLAVFAVDPKTGRLTFIEHQSTRGHLPRCFAIDPTGHWLLAENQASDSVVVFTVDAATGKLQPTGQTLAIGTPVCAVFVEAK